MLENVLKRNNATTKTKITVKALVSVGIIALAVILPQIAHIAVGADAGIKWMPMYLPILLGGCLLGAKNGAIVGLLAPVASYILTASVGEAMPSLERLPFMMAELLVYAFVVGLFSEKVQANAIVAFPAVVLAQFSGRLAYIGLVALFGNFTVLNTSIVLSQIKSGVPGLVAQAIIAPVIIIALRRVMNKKAQ